MGVGFAEYFRISVLCLINTHYARSHTVSLLPYHTFKNSNDQNKALNVSNLKKRIEFLNPKGKKYLITIFIQEESTFDQVLETEFLKPFFWGIDARHDVKEVNIDDSVLERLVLEYEVSFESNKEVIYVSISEL